MKRESENSSGSFRAWGTGFNYHYDAYLKKFEISHAKNDSPVLFLDFDKELSGDPELFVCTLDKACQLRALTLTNNTSLDLSEIFDDGRLTPMVYETARLARFGFDLMQNNFERFERYFCQGNHCNVNVGRIRKFDAGSASFAAKFETTHNSRVAVECATLHGVMSKLSQKIIQDLIPREFVYRFDGVARSLLKTSSNISVLSLILNEKFSPSTKLREIREKRSKRFTEQ